MRISGRMVFLVLLILTTISCNEEEPVEWEVRESYVLSTDAHSRIFVHDDQGVVLATLTPLQDSMEGIYSPVLFDNSQRIAFLSSAKPDKPPSLCVTDRSGEELLIYEGLYVDQLDGSQATPILYFTINEGYQKIYTLSVLNDPPSADYLFRDTIAQSETSGPVILRHAFAPSLSPDGSEIAFINKGLYWDTLVDMFGRKTPIQKERIDIGRVNQDGSDYRLVTGNQLPYRTLPSSSWLGLSWSHDGKWIFAVSKDDETNALETIYAVHTEYGSVHIVTRDYFRFYNYFCPSPTGDTIILGTCPPHADLYVVTFSDENGNPKIGYTRTRLTDSEIYTEPNWKATNP
ncbi:PD40 domain-containing protein [candidate division WOR-3 bacterium]|nr:PD40 domain-containing protein [candidate division WOR-3 bacterium]